MNEPQPDNSAFSPGDIVRLKSGGPAMTVWYVENVSVTCLWFPDAMGFKSGAFPPFLLVKSNSDHRLPFYSGLQQRLPGIGGDFTNQP